MNKIKILIVSHTIPENRMGGGILLYRHFAERRHFQVGVLTTNSSSGSEGFHRHFAESAWLSRLKRTRLSIWFHDYTHIVHARMPDRRLRRAAEDFHPDVIFNVAETYFSFHALRLARQLGVPFACYFMDWANYAACSHRWAVPIMDRMYRKLYREADLALCISEGMMEELGPHPNVRVVYPISGGLPDSAAAQRVESTPFTFCFAGNLAHWYGQQIAQIIRLCEESATVGLRVFGMHQNWTEEFETRQRERGVFLGFRPYEELVPEFQASDAFLLPMGFEPEAALIERTSFKTKFLDYIGFDKAILVWGPEYCTAVRVARKYGSALCITDPSPEAAYEGMRRIATEPELRQTLIRNAALMRETDFHPDRIHAILRVSLMDLVKIHKTNNGTIPVKNN